MTDYPVNLILENRLCVVVGAGPVGLRKVRGLLESGARVRLVTLAPPPANQVPRGIEIRVGSFRPTDLEGAFLVFAATSERQINAAVAREARRQGRLVSVADTPAEGDFTLPALLRRGRMTIGVSTGGASPALAAQVRDRLAESFGPEWAWVLEIAAALRRKRLTLLESSEYNREIVRSLLDGKLPELLAGGELAAIDRLLKTLLGEGCSLADLGIRPPKGTT